MAFLEMTFIKRVAYIAMKMELLEMTFRWFSWLPIPSTLCCLQQLSAWLQDPKMDCMGQGWADRWSLGWAKHWPPPCPLLDVFACFTGCACLGRPLWSKLFIWPTEKSIGLVGTQCSTYVKKLIAMWYIVGDIYSLWSLCFYWLNYHSEWFVKATCLWIKQIPATIQKTTR
jgi:hypothetical protein